MKWLFIWQALGYVHGAQIVHASEAVHGRLRYINISRLSYFILVWWYLFGLMFSYFIGFTCHKKLWIESIFWMMLFCLLHLKHDKLYHGCTLEIMTWQLFSHLGLYAFDSLFIDFTTCLMPCSEIEHDGCRLFHNIPSGTESGFKVSLYSYMWNFINYELICGLSFIFFCIPWLLFDIWLTAVSWLVYSIATGRALFQYFDFLQ